MKQQQANKEETHTHQLYKTTKLKIKIKKPKTSSTKNALKEQNETSPKSVLQFNLHWPTTPGPEACPDVLSVYQWDCTGENYFFFLCKQVPVVAPWLGMGAHVHLPFSVLGPHRAWTCAGHMRAATICVNSYVLHQPCCFRKTLFSWVYVISAS